VFPYYDTDAQQLVIDMAAIRDHALSTFELRIDTDGRDSVWGRASPPSWPRPARSTPS
jgi:hypothetical protein